MHARETVNYFFFPDGPATFHRPVRIGHFSRELKMAIAAWSAPLCAELAGNHGVSFTVISSLRVANAWSVAAMDVRGVRARMAPNSRDAGGRPPLPTHALPTLRGPRASFSRCDRIFCARSECVGKVLPSRWCAAAEGRQCHTWANFWLLRRRAFYGDSVMETP